MVSIVLLLALLDLSGCRSPNAAGGDALDWVSSTKTNRVVLLVHGIFGDKAETWTNSSTQKMFSQLLATDPEMAGFCVATYSYESPYFRRSSSIAEIGQRLADRLEHEGLLSEDKRLYLVGHSMGGLVIKAAVTSLNTPSKQKELRRICGVLFLSTPNQGSELARFGKYSGNLSASDMRQLSTYLIDLDKRWVTLVTERISAGAAFPRAFGCYETKSFRPIGVIVGYHEAVTAVDQAVSGLELDHSEMAKPAGPSGDSYEWVKWRIKDIDSLQLARIPHFWLERAERLTTLEEILGAIEKATEAEDRQWLTWRVANQITLGSPLSADTLDRIRMVLTAALRSNDSDLRRTAAGAAAALAAAGVEDTEVAELLTREAQSTDMDERLAAVRALGLFRAPIAQSTLARMGEAALSSIEITETQREAFYALSRRDTASEPRVFLEGLQKPLLREFSAHGLQQLRSYDNRDVAEVLLGIGVDRLVRGPNQAVTLGTKIALIHLIGSLDDEKMRPLLVGWMRSPDLSPFIRLEAASTGCPGGIQFLERTMSERRLDGRGDAEELFESNRNWFSALAAFQLARAYAHQDNSEEALQYLRQSYSMGFRAPERFMSPNEIWPHSVGQPREVFHALDAAESGDSVDHDANWVSEAGERPREFNVCSWWLTGRVGIERVFGHNVTLDPWAEEMLVMLPRRRSTPDVKWAFKIDAAPERIERIDVELGYEIEFDRFLPRGGYCEVQVAMSNAACVSSPSVVLDGNRGGVRRVQWEFRPRGTSSYFRFSLTGTKLLSGLRLLDITVRPRMR